MDLTKQDAADRVFMAQCLWREARGESREGKVGVAACILNRVARPSWWGRNVFEVIGAKWQFSSMTDPRDPQLIKYPKPNDPSWQECMDVAWEALDGRASNPVPGADSYYDISLDAAGKAPVWIKTARFCGQIGRIKFYDVDHDFQVQGA